MVDVVCAGRCEGCEQADWGWVERALEARAAAARAEAERVWVERAIAMMRTAGWSYARIAEEMRRAGYQIDQEAVKKRWLRSLERQKAGGGAG